MTPGHPTCDRRKTGSQRVAGSSFLSLRSPQDAQYRSVCFASNSPPESKEEKRSPSNSGTSSCFCHSLLSKPICRRLCRLSTHSSSTQTRPAHVRLGHPSSPSPRVFSFSTSIPLLSRNSYTKNTPGQVKIHTSSKELSAIIQPPKNKLEIQFQLSYGC